MLRTYPTDSVTTKLTRWRVVWLSVALLFLLASPAVAEPEVVVNTTEPALGRQVVQMEELWRAGGEDDDVFFGNVGSVKLDAEGNILLLDSQLSEVHVFDTDGEILRTIGREGDGPGEVRQPSDLFLADDGTICLLQGFPGRIVKLTPDGLPAGDANYGTSADAQGQFAVLNRGLADPAGMVLVGIRMSMGGGAVSRQTYFLDRCDDQAKQTHTFLEKDHVINYAQFELDEAEMDFVWTRLAADGAGRVIAAPKRNEYEVEVYAADGTHEMTFTRPYESLTRNETQRKIARQIIEGVGAYYPVPPVKITIEDTEPDIAGIQITADGRIWVQTSRGLGETADGTWQTIDVFTADGKFERQVAVIGGHDGERDGLVILPDGRAVVIVGALDAFLTQQGVSEQEQDADAEETSPLEVICYRLDLN